MGLKVVRAGIYSIIQDLGRIGQYRHGLSQSGPVDKASFDWTNRILTNHKNAAQIEVLFGDCEFVALKDLVMCVCGAPAPLFIDQQPVQMWRSHNVKKGQKIAIGNITHGARCYIGVAGGFNIPQTMGSAATTVREGIGGLEGKGEPLKDNDFLCCPTAHFSHHFQLPFEFQFSKSNPLIFNVVLSYQHEYFSEVAKQLFFTSDYLISQQFDRMGCRLEGPAIRPPITNMYSEGISLGAIQLTNEGQPIILLNDRQTLGGYAKIGTILSIDLSMLGQCVPSEQISFKPMTVLEAQQRLHFHRNMIANVQLEVVN